MENKKPYFRPLDWGLFKFPQNYPYPENPEIGSIFQHPETGEVYQFTGIDPYSGKWGKMINETSFIGGLSPNINGRIITVDKDHPNSTDDRTGLNNYDENHPFKTINSGVGATRAGDMLVVNKASTPYQESIQLNLTGFILIINGATIDGGVNPAITSIQRCFIFLYNGAFILNTGNSSDKDNTAALNLFADGFIVANGFMNTIYNIQSNNSYAINSRNSGFYLININATSTGDLLSAGTQLKAKWCTFNPSSTGGNVINGTGTSQLLIMEDCQMTKPIMGVGLNLYMTNCKMSVSNRDNAIIATMASGGNFLIRRCHIISKQTPIQITQGGGQPNMEVTFSQIGTTTAGAFNAAVFTGTNARLVCANNIINYAFLVSGITPSNDIVANNILHTATAGYFPITNYF